MEADSHISEGSYPFCFAYAIVGYLRLLWERNCIMCGIIGYTGPLEADNILLNGLAGLEYRGYDSAGIAYFGNDSKIHLIKTVGKVAALKNWLKQEATALPTVVSDTPVGQPMAVLQQQNAHPHRQDW